MTGYAVVSVGGYPRRWAIIAEATNISIFTDLKPTEIMGCNHLLYFLLATVLHSKQYCTEERLNKKRLLYIQNTVVYIKMESHDLSQKHYTTARM